jgi:hypothetical protein
LRRWSDLLQLWDKTSARVAEAYIEVESRSHIVISSASFLAIADQPVTMRIAARWTDSNTVATACETRVGRNFQSEQAEPK